MAPKKGVGGRPRSLTAPVQLCHLPAGLSCHLSCSQGPEGTLTLCSRCKAFLPRAHCSPASVPWKSYTDGFHSWCQHN